MEKLSCKLACSIIPEHVPTRFADERETILCSMTVCAELLKPVCFSSFRIDTAKSNTRNLSVFIIINRIFDRNFKIGPGSMIETILDNCMVIVYSDQFREFYCTFPFWS